MNRWRHILTMFAFSVVAVLISITLVQARKPDNPGGGNGGGSGGGGGGQATYTLVPLPDATGSTSQFNYGFAFAVHELHDDSAGLVGVEVVGLLDRDAYYWAIASSGEVLGAYPLSLPVGSDPAAAFTDAYDINEHGTIVGSGGTETTDGTTLYPLIWPDAFSEPFELPLFADVQAYGRAFDINDNGLIVGIAYLAGARRLVVWGLNADGEVVGPEVLIATDLLRGPKLNNLGTIVATLDNSQGYRWQVNWDGQNLSVSAPELLTVETESGSVPFRVDSINELGDICGTFHRDSGWPQACVLTAAGTRIDMPALIDNKSQGTASQVAWDLSDSADPSQIQVIASAYTYDKRQGLISGNTAVVWRGDLVTELNDVTQQPESNLQFGTTLQVISDKGWIAGAGWDSNGDSAPLLLMPN